ncbi:hypothetical protein [Fundidesulfovibrio terrae]|uniref:hypothetical protein n=1 Tax=Fundidesulfovibrio terrae TaxID=2922866 RepID=UPI001FAEBEBE|nr:hypothetical protein [Fundidesulfovibrio terrae]
MLKAVIAALLTVFLALPALAQQQMGPQMMGNQPMGSQMMNRQTPGPIPNLVGAWEAGDFQLHHKTHGFIKAEGNTAKLVVTAQEGRVFHGTVEWGGKNAGKDSFSGVIDKDNTTFYLAGHTEGLRLGKMEGPDAFTFYYLVPGGVSPRAGYVEYKRAK